VSEKNFKINTLTYILIIFEAERIDRLKIMTDCANLSDEISLLNFSGEMLHILHTIATQDIYDMKTNNTGINPCS
jgi:hypothetical protein